MPDTVFIGCPTYNNFIHAGAARSIYQSATQRYNTLTMTAARGLTSPNCNAIWVSALNERRRNPEIKWFAMLHADVEPAPGWLDTLIDEAERHSADMVSAVVPLKEHSGLTSTVIGTSDWTAEYLAVNRGLAKRFGRLTLRQVLHSRFPATFGINECCDALAQLPDDLRVTNAPRDILLLNTGCMVLRLTANIDWSKVYFSVIDGIVDDGKHYRYFDVSEDWMFSARLTLAGVKCMATKTVKVVHHGRGEFPNDKPWGTVYREADGIEAV